MIVLILVLMNFGKGIVNQYPFSFLTDISKSVILTLCLARNGCFQISFLFYL